MAKAYQAVKAEVAGLIPEAPGVKTLILKPEHPLVFAPGQFAQLLIPGKGEAPFSPTGSPEKPDQIEITAMKRGRLTSLIHRLPPGAIVGLRGPYGRGYPVEEFEGKELLLIGGGVGIAGLRSLLWSVLSRIENYPRLILLYGAKAPEDLIYQGWLLEKARRNLLEAHLIVENGNGAWAGKKGLVTGLLEEIQLDPGRTMAVACGPLPMMKATAHSLSARGFKPGQIYLSMERNMSCGIGKCGHCRMGDLYVCKDGPVFAYGRLLKTPNLWE